MAAGPKLVNSVQQARDVVAIVKAMGREMTSVFGNSAGGKIAFQVAVSFPEMLDHVIAHDAPTYPFLPNGGELVNWCCEVHDIYLTQGLAAAATFFRTAFKGFSAADPPRTNCEPKDWEVFWQDEFLIFTMYCPDQRQIKEKGVWIAVATGWKSEDANYSLSTLP